MPTREISRDQTWMITPEGSRAKRQENPRHRTLERKNRKLPSGKFRGNQFFLGLLVVVYNLMQFFKRDCLPRVYRAVSFATVRRHFLEHAVVIEERSEVEIHLVFNADYPPQREANLMLRKILAA